jgi:hypothetical protein
MPHGRDAAYMMDVRVGVECMEGSALSAARKFCEMLGDSAQPVHANAAVSAVSPLGPSICGNVVARSLQTTLSIDADRTHYFLTDLRNLAAGAARAAQVANLTAAPQFTKKPSLWATGATKHPKHLWVPFHHSCMRVRQR